MTRDQSTKMSKKSSKKEMKKRSTKKDVSLKKKKIVQSDSDSNSDSDYTYQSESDSDTTMDEHEFRKYIQQIFPSKHMDKKIKAGEKLKKSLASDEASNESEEEAEVCTKKKHSRRRRVEESEPEEEYEEECEEDTEESEEWETEEEEAEEEEVQPKKSSRRKKAITDSEEEEEAKHKFNFILTIGDAADDDDDEWLDDSDETDPSNDATEDEDEEVSTDESSADEEEEEEEVVVSKKSAKTKASSKTQTKTSAKKKPKTNNKEDTQEDIQEDWTEQDCECMKETIDKLREMSAKNPRDIALKKSIQVYDETVRAFNAKKEKKIQKQKDKNMRIFKKILKDKNMTNDFTFYEKMETSSQVKLIKELREINKITRIEKPYRMTLLEANIPIQFKASAMKKVNSLRHMEPGSGDYYKIKNWVDTFMKIPFTEYRDLPVNINDGVDKCHAFMEEAQQTLDAAVYGLNDAKMQIMQMLGQLVTNPKAIGTAFAIHGPPGTGKTSLVKEGVSKILNRPFAFIALGGATDSSFLEGHGYTYEGSMWGKIVQILIDSKCMNPVIYFDELDKISETPRGDEIVGILTHLTDTSQNSQFHDKYFADIDFDLSKCLFIFSYNDETKVNPILRDRMYRIKTKGYSGKEKTVIANQYLLPKIREQVKFNDGDIIIPDDVLAYINDTHCHKEDGVRNMKRSLEIIHTKLNLYRLMRPGSNLFENEMSVVAEFPFKVTKDIVDKLIKKEEQNMSAMYSMYV